MPYNPMRFLDDSPHRPTIEAMLEPPAQDVAEAARDYLHQLVDRLEGLGELSVAIWMLTSLDLGRERYGR